MCRNKRVSAASYVRQATSERVSACVSPTDGKRSTGGKGNKVNITVSHRLHDLTIITTGNPFACLLSVMPGSNYSLIFRGRERLCPSAPDSGILCSGEGMMHVTCDLHMHICSCLSVHVIRRECTFIFRQEESFQVEYFVSLHPTLSLSPFCRMRLHNKNPDRMHEKRLGFDIRFLAIRRQTGERFLPVQILSESMEDSEGHTRPLLSSRR